MISKNSYMFLILTFFMWTVFYTIIAFSGKSEYEMIPEKK